LEDNTFGTNANFRNEQGKGPKNQNGIGDPARHRSQAGRSSRPMSPQFGLTAVEAIGHTPCGVPILHVHNESISHSRSTGGTNPWLVANMRDGETYGSWVWAAEVASRRVQKHDAVVGRAQGPLRLAPLVARGRGLSQPRAVVIE